MALDVNGKTALVTGGGSGICLEFTKILLENGCNVVIADLALTPPAEELINTTTTTTGSPKAIFIKTNVTSWSQLQIAFDTALTHFKTLDIVCPGAGVFEPPSSNFWHFKSGQDQISQSSYKTLDINITHPIRCTQLAIDSFKRQKLSHGVVTLISSTAAQSSILFAPLYCASKHAISGFVRSLADLEPKLGIRVNAVAPGKVMTPLWTPDKLAHFEEDETWVSARRVAEVMLDLVQRGEYVGGTVMEMNGKEPRKVELLNDSGPQVSSVPLPTARFERANEEVYGVIEREFGK